MKFTVLSGYLSFVLSLLLSLPHVTMGARYQNPEVIVGGQFLTAFEFEAIEDPTHGRVNYVDMPTALRKGLVQSTFDSFVMRADSTTNLTADGPGRDSVRIKSKKTYTTHVAIFDVRHMPQGCGTWPAIWEVDEQTWPVDGEVDIMEGVNGQGTNAATLHTDAGCTMPAVRNETGTPTQLDCNVAVNYNAGCGVQMQQPLSFGPSFNQNGGGWYALERTNQHISVWFWPRHDNSVPRDITECGNEIDTSTWGIPSAYFPNDTCDIASHFGNHNIIFDQTFCGDWAGNPYVYASSGCPSTCVDFVNYNPSAFVDAFFDIASIHIYQPPPFCHRGSKRSGGSGC